MIHRMEEIPITATSYPFTSAEKYLNLSSRGYEEKEYYMYGSANVYQTGGNGQLEIKNEDVEYVNRIVVRQPKDIADFSGNVVVEIINSTSGMDIDRMWILGWRQFLRCGDIYVGITSKHNTAIKLKEFDPVRYEKISWPNPTPEIQFPFTDEEYQNMGAALGDLDLQSEPGLLWDMLTDLGLHLKSNSVINPIKKFRPKRVVLTGWSQSACHMILYMNQFAHTVGCEDAYDGFLLGAPPRAIVSSLNQYEVLSTPATLENTKLNIAKKPTIIFQTESENGMFGGASVRREDEIFENYLVREYDITGSSHDTLYSYVDYYCDDEDLKRIHHLPEYVAKNESANNYPSFILVGAAYRNLFYWIQSGVAPAECELISINADGSNQKDTFGITRGGLRTCLLDYPTGGYYNSSDIELGQNPLFPDSNKEVLFGHEEPYSSAFLKELYGDLDHYRTLVTEHTNHQITKGFVVREDAEELIELAVNQAKERGLE